MNVQTVQHARQNQSTSLAMLLKTLSATRVLKTNSITKVWADVPSTVANVHTDVLQTCPDVLVVVPSISANHCNSVSTALPAQFTTTCTHMKNVRQQETPCVTNSVPPIISITRKDVYVNYVVTVLVLLGHNVRLQQIPSAVIPMSITIRPLMTAHRTVQNVH